MAEYCNCAFHQNWVMTKVGSLRLRFILRLNILVQLWLENSVIYIPMWHTGGHSKTQPKPFFQCRCSYCISHLCASVIIYCGSGCQWIIVSGVRHGVTLQPGRRPGPQGGRVLTRAAEWLCQLRGHDLNDQADAETEHLAEEAGLRADVHGQEDHDLLQDRQTWRLTSKLKRQVG